MSGASRSAAVSGPSRQRPSAGRVLTIVVLLLLMALLYVKWFTASAQVTVELESALPGSFKIYWSDDRRFYAETRTGGAHYKAGRSRIAFYIGDLGGMTRLRIDPLDTPGEVAIRSLSIRQNGFEALRFDSAAAFEDWRPVGDIGRWDLEGGALRLASIGHDPRFETTIAPRARLWNLEELLPLVLMLAAWMALLLLEPRFGPAWGWVPWAMTAALVLSCAMAVLSAANAHPDEVMHVLAAEYYEKNWLPPPICAPEILHTYSPYGVSRLHSPEIVYFLAGKCSRVLSILPVLAEDLFLRMRLFNLTLLALLLVVAVRHSASRLLLIPILLSAQVWYQFGSFNSDAYGLFMITVGALQVLDRDSRLNRFLTADALQRPLREALTLGLLVLLLLPVKKNNFSFHLFALLALGYRYWRLAPPARRRMLRRGSAMLLCAVCVASPLLAGEWRANWPGRNAKLSACREQTASTAYRESTPPADQHPTLHFQRRGIPPQELITRFAWHEKMFRSAFGVYGYLSVAARQPFYDTVAALAAVWLLYVTAWGLWRSPWGERGVGMVLLLIAAVLVGVTFRHAWVHDFQAQGRYLLPLVTLAGIWLQRCGARLDRTILNGLSLALFAMACYSMLGVGLAGLAHGG